MDIQNGLVDLQTTTIETGAIDTPKFISTNYEWPVKARHDSMNFLLDGNSLMALYPATIHQMSARVKAESTNNKKNSAGRKPSS